MLCQFYNRCEVHILPVYKPSEDEKSDAFLFANNVRQYVAEWVNLFEFENLSTYDPPLPTFPNFTFIFQRIQGLATPAAYYKCSKIHAKYHGCSIINYFLCIP